MDTYKCIIVLSACLLGVCGQSIKQIIEQRPELITLKGYMTQLSTLEQLGRAGSKKFTFFAAQNEAFERVPTWVRQKYGPGRTLGETARSEINNIMRYHTVYDFDGTVHMLDDLGDIVLKTDAHDAAPLFFKKIGNKQYVNGARIVEADIQASNGVVHIIDHFLYQPAESHNALTYVQTHVQESDPTVRTMLFNNLLKAYETNVEPTLTTGFSAREILNSVSNRVTLFVPNDATLGKVNTNRIIGDTQLLKKVVESHIIRDDTYHEALLELLADQDIPALMGKITPKRFGKNLYVSNFCASGVISKSNITVENGVVYIIDGVMGHVYNDLLGKMREYRDISNFYTKVASSTAVSERLKYHLVGTELAENKKLTVFAPLNEAMLNEDVLQVDGNHLENALRLHIIEGKLEVSQMKNNTVRRTIRDGYDAKFIRVERDGNIDVYVEVNYVRGRIVTGDICTFNGVMHKVDNIIGTPTQNIYKYIYDAPNFSNLRKAISDTGLAQVLGDETRRLTMFLPTDKAFVIMRSGELGRKLLQPEHVRNLKNVLNRHIIETDVIIDQLNMGVTVLQSKFKDTFTLDKQVDKVTIRFGTFTINVFPYDMRMTNGMVHVIDHVLYDEGNPNAGEWASPASINSRSLPLIVTVCLFHLWSRTL